MIVCIWDLMKNLTILLSYCINKKKVWNCLYTDYKLYSHRVKLICRLKKYIMSYYSISHLLKLYGHYWESSTGRTN
jgi:hypothetical protein